MEKVVHKKRYMIWKFIRYFRLFQFWDHKSKTQKGVYKRLARLYRCYYLRKKNIYGELCNIEISNNAVIGKNLNIYHGGIVISSATIGENCTLRGNTVIGNKGLIKYDGEPVIGSNVEIGVGANIIGNITIADHCEIGANAMVNKSFLDPGSIIVGVPARKIERG